MQVDDVDLRFAVQVEVNPAARLASQTSNIFEAAPHSSSCISHMKLSVGE